MARNGPPPSAKGKAKAYGPPTRASPRLVALRSQSAIKSQPEAPVTPAVPALATAKRIARMLVNSYSMKLADRDGPSNIAPTPSLPPKKRPIQKAAGEGTSKCITALGRPYTSTPKEQIVIVVGSDSEPEPALEDTIHKIVEMAEDEAPQNAGVKEEEEYEEEPEEDPVEESVVELVLRKEDDYADYWALVDSESKNAARDDPCFWNYDGDLPNWGDVDPANSSSRSCTRPPPANL
ncbi:hypothetical protein PIB30_032532 [Stylosanthes scabra]|uniref:Uncharacterized protein n=1 Tax=Stylosanthes scabra TaxID=79078 RepID=A0ABU6YCL7_9FABA|nr:hypothetical protein [Stylosanthes scabra]